MEPKIYFCSDWHFGHNKDFLYGPRGFKNPYEMSEAIIKNHNEIVNPEDHVYVLGDLMLDDNDYGLKCIKQLKGHIHVVRGNHDTDTRIPLYEQCWNVDEVVTAKYLRYGKYHFYLSHYPCLCGNHDDDKPLKARMISVCGHVHTQDKWADWDKGLIYHVDMDAHACRPVLIDDIIKDIKEKIK